MNPNGRPRQNIAERFWNKVTITDGCWLWTAHRDKDGYGAFKLPSGQHVRAHRMAFELDVGMIPEGTFVLHRCDNPPCCNPDHLFIGTSRDNIVDMVTKQRQARGEQDGNAKLTVRQVRAIRRGAAAGRTYAELAPRFGVDRSTVGRVVNGDTWVHLERDS